MPKEPRVHKRCTHVIGQDGEATCRDFPADDGKDQAAQSWDSAAVGRAPKRSGLAAKKLRKRRPQRAGKTRPWRRENSIDRPPVPTMPCSISEKDGRVATDIPGSRLARWTEAITCSLRTTGMGPVGEVT